MATFSSLILAFCTPGLLAAAPAQEKQDKADTQAKEAAELFVKALKAEDVDAVLKVTDVPFFWDGEKIVKERDALKAAFGEVFREKDLTKLDYAIKEVHPSVKLPDLVKPEKHKQLAKEFVGEIDHVVVVEVKREIMAVLVRIRDGKAKVAGLFD